MLDRQAIVNKVYPAIITQGPSVNSHGLCRYRAPNGRKCVVGMLIDDDHYLPDMEGKGLHSLLVQEALAKSGFFLEAKDILFLSALQAAHDVAARNTFGKDEEFGNAFRERMIPIARDYDLILPS